MPGIEIKKKDKFSILNLDTKAVLSVLCKLLGKVHKVPDTTPSELSQMKLQFGAPFLLIKGE